MAVGKFSIPREMPVVYVPQVVREILFILAVAAAGTIPVLVIAFLLFSR